MQPIILSRSEFRDKVYACWLGKNIGGTLGAPIECLRHTHALTYYDPLPDRATPNDDLDLQLIWLAMLEEQGTDPPLPLLAEYWARHAACYPWNEYGFFMRNYTRGLRPPVAGCFENYFVDEMGSPIRSEIWACLHPADPDAAAAAAWKDSALDHAGGEGTCGEMFWAAVESAAFVEHDPEVLIRIGLNAIPLSSHVARSIREAVWCRQNGLSLGRARERIASRFGHIQPCNAVPNHGFTILGWLYGADFGDRLCKAVNCGYDTDCTGATLGSLLGILGGTAGIPARWSEPVGTDIVVHKFTRNFAPPKTLDELTDRTVALAEAAAVGQGSPSGGLQFADQTALPGDLRTRLFRTERAAAARARDIHAGTAVCDGREVSFHYGGEPVLRPGTGKVVRVMVDGREEPVKLDVPAGWECLRQGPARFLLRCDGEVADHNLVTVRLGLDGGAPGADRANFVILGPGEAKGFPAGDNVPTCPRCRARVEACLCGPAAG